MVATDQALAMSLDDVIKQTKPRAKKETSSPDGRPAWDNRTRVTYAEERRGGRSSLGEPTMPFPLPWGSSGGPGRQ